MRFVFWKVVIENVEQPGLIEKQSTILLSESVSQHSFICEIANLAGN